MNAAEIQTAAIEALLFLSAQPDHKATAEQITEACKRAGFHPADDRSFGGVMRYLSVHSLAKVVGHCYRKRGHGTAGGHVWELV